MPEGEFDLVVSAPAVHHLTSGNSLTLSSGVGQRLTVGGRFVLGDVIVPDSPEDADTPLEPEVDLPDRLQDQLDWLENARSRSGWRVARPMQHGTSCSHEDARGAARGCRPADTARR